MKSSLLPVKPGDQERGRVAVGVAGDEGGEGAPSPCGSWCRSTPAGRSRNGGVLTRGRIRRPTGEPPPAADACDPDPRRRQPEGRRRQDDDGRLARRRAGRAGPAGAARRPRPAGLPDVLARHRPRGPRAVGAPRAARPGRPRPRRCSRPTTASTCCPPTIELAGAEADLLDPHRPRARRCAPRSSRGRRRLRLGAARLPAVARRAHRQRADRRRRGAHPAAVRDALAPRRRPAARHRRTTYSGSPTAALEVLGRAADAVRRAHQPRPRGARRRRPSATTSRCSSRRSPSRSGSPRRRPPAGRSWRPRRSAKGAAAYREHAQLLMAAQVAT